MAYKQMTSFVERSQRGGPTWAAASNRTKIADGSTLSDAFKAAGMDYTIVKASMAIIYRDQFNQKQIIPDDHFRLIREPHGGQGAMRIGDVVGANYGLIQNMEIAQMVDPLTRTWPVETAGEFESGTTVYGLLSAGGSTIGGDEMKDYFLVSDNRDGGTALEIAFTPVRVVCWNTLQMALKRASTRVRLMHTIDIKAQAELFIELFGQLRMAQDAGHAVMTAMYEAKVDAGDIETLVNRSFPTREAGSKLAALNAIRPTGEDDAAKAARFAQWKAVEAATQKSGGLSVDDLQRQLDQQNERVKMQRTLARDLYARELDDHKTTGDNLWLAVNAIVEAVDWGGASELDEDKAQTRAEQTMFGTRADVKGRAMRAAEDLMLAGRR
jgi:hypothetical protein